MQVSLPHWHDAGVTAPLYATLDTDFAFGLIIWDGVPAHNPRNVVSNEISVIAKNGTPPYTYFWVPVSNPDSINITASTNYKTTFWKSITAGNTYYATFKCLVTDATATVVATANVSVELAHESGA